MFLIVDVHVYVDTESRCSSGSTRVQRAEDVSKVLGTMGHNSSIVGSGAVKLW